MGQEHKGNKKACLILPDSIRLFSDMISEYDYCLDGS